MTEVMMSPFGMSSVTIKEKPVVVRVKRKASQASLDAFWLEINGRPLKRSLLDFEKISLSDHESIETVKTKRLLVQRVETVSHAEAIEDVLQYLLPNSGGSGGFSRKIEGRKDNFKRDKKQLRSLARQEREEHIRSARFEQIWKSRKGDTDSLREICHLYDVVRVDGEEEKPIKKKEVERISPEDNAILCNYLPLLREYIPSAVEEIESEIKAYVSSEGSGSVAVANDAKGDDYLYDLYTVDEFTGNEEEISLSYPSVQVKDDDDFNDTPDSDYDSEDSNAEDHPRNDYPDEESVEDDEADPFGDSECPNSDYEEEMANNRKDETSNNGDEDMEPFSTSEYSGSEHDDEDNLRWGYR